MKTVALGKMTLEQGWEIEGKWASWLSFELTENCSDYIIQQVMKCSYTLILRGNLGF